MQARGRNGLLKRLWSFWQRKDQPSEGSLIGSQRLLGVASRRRAQYLLEIPEIPIRPINDSIETARSLIEMKTWSYEVRHSLRLLSRDPFQNVEGSADSWTIEAKNAEAQAIAEDLQRRKAGKIPIIGGNRLERAVFDMLWAGDAFLELGIEKEGISKNDWCIAQSNYLPPLSIFAEEDDLGRVSQYIQRRQLSPSQDDRYIHPVKTLHFQHDEVGVYGSSLFIPSVEPWNKVKDCFLDIADAARNLGMSPWLHIMPTDTAASYKLQYQQELEDLRRDGIITDLYLLPGAEVKKAANDTQLEPLISYWVQLRYQLIPPSVPIWMFPGLGVEDKGGREIANQPALAYARTISHIRSIVSEQIEWAIAVEIVLRKGFDWFQENGEFEIVWAKWMTTGNEADLLESEDKPNGNQLESGTDARATISASSNGKGSRIYDGN